MKKMKIIGIADNGKYTFTTGGIMPCVCLISDIQFLDESPVLTMKVDVVSRGKYTNLKRKKMIRRTLVSMLRCIVKNFKN